MGMLDSECIFSNAQAVTATGDTASTNVYDTGTPYNNAQDAENALSNENLWINVFVNTQVAGVGLSTAAVLQPRLITRRGRMFCRGRRTTGSS